MLRRVIKDTRPILELFPLVGRFLKIWWQKQFKTELELIKGTHQNTNEHPSILHFSFNKAASQYIKTILCRCTVENGMTLVDINSYSFHSDFPFLDHLSAEEMEKYHHIFKAQGYLYSVFGGMIEGIPQLDKYKIILFARDPRDILVSEYYSMAYSHSAPSRTGNKFDNYMNLRKKAREIPIDDYVIAESDRVFDTYQRYQNLLLNKYPNTYLTTYEQMVMDFGGWLKALIDYCELSVSKELFQSLVSENDRSKKPKKENIRQHRRKGKPGDYKEKLKPETIRYLDTKFELVLETFGYNYTTFRNYDYKNGAETHMKQLSCVSQNTDL
jgi:hypothetical protein